jgi:hypothetical protein
MGVNLKLHYARSHSTYFLHHCSFADSACKSQAHFHVFMSDSETELAIRAINGSAPRPVAQPKPRPKKDGKSQRNDRVACEKLDSLLPYESRGATSLVDGGGIIKLGGFRTSTTGILRSAFGPEGCTSIHLGDHVALQFAASSSAKTSRDSQVVVSDALWQVQSRRVDEILANRSFRYLFIKRVWDEATLFFNLPRHDLLRILGREAASYIERLPKRLQDVSKRRRPCFTAQVSRGINVFDPESSFLETYQNRICCIIFKDARIAICYLSIDQKSSQYTFFF